MLNTKKPETFSYYHHKVDQVKMHIHNRLDQDLSIKYLADVSCVSYHHLRDIFKMIEGQPIKQYIKMSRAEKAAKLLLSTRMTLDEIAREVGFANKSSLSIAFKNTFAVSPGQYRKKKQGAIH